MPAMDDIKSSWADEVLLDAGGLPPPAEVIENGNKIITEYTYNKDDKKVKVVRTYKITKIVVSKSAAKRKSWAKFGDSANDKSGPNAQTTIISEEVQMQFISAKEEEKTNDLVDPLKSIAKCRICNGEHWSVNCPYKGTSMDPSKIYETKAGLAPGTPGAAAVDASKTGKYVPPFMKDGKGLSLGLRGRDDTTAIRISNLSESMVETDLEELVKRICPYHKIYLARDKNTGLCKGFAYVHYKNRNDAATAIKVLHGHGYDHLILNVEWSKPHVQA